MKRSKYPSFLKMRQGYRNLQLLPLGLLHICGLVVACSQSSTIVDQQVVVNSTHFSASVITDGNGTRYFESTQSILVSRDADGFFVDAADDNSMIPWEEIEVVERERRSCDYWTSSGCEVLSEADRKSKYFSMRFKIFDCKGCQPRKKVFRFYAMFPGIYVIRYTDERGAQVIVVRTYRHHQVKVIPVLFHFSRGSKCFLMIRKTKCGGYIESSYGFDSLELDEALDDFKSDESSGSNDSCSSSEEGSFKLLYRGSDWAVLTPRKPFNNDKYYQVGSCPLFSRQGDCTLLFDKYHHNEKFNNNSPCHINTNTSAPATACI